MEIPIASTLKIRDEGFDEYWLQDQIFENPSCLTLGELEVVSKERTQSSGGRLDILLKNPEDDTMYEVEVMLGETDESHIIRTIEYWDNEKRRWPQRQHYAVLVAESITRRFFNVIQLFSHSIPIIAIQVNMIKSHDQKALHFTKVLDTYEEPDDGGGDGGLYDEAFWKAKAQWTVDAVDEFLKRIGKSLSSPTLRYLKYYIAINVNGTTYFRFNRRSAGKSLFNFRIKPDQIDDMSTLLDENNISFVLKRSRFRFKVDKKFINSNLELLEKITEFVRIALSK